MRYEAAPADRFHVLIVLRGGGGLLAGHPFRAGETWLVPASAGPFDIVPDGRARFLETWVPAT